MENNRENISLGLFELVLSLITRANRRPLDVMDIKCIGYHDDY
jgi:hypothetical protein